jgi:hypothetical protein
MSESEVFSADSDASWTSLAMVVSPQISFIIVPKVTIG